jgi:hypothetical protein
LNHKLNKNINLLFFLLTIISLSIATINTASIDVVLAQQTDGDITYLGVDMSGFHTRNPQARNPSYDLPANYFEDSFRILSEAGMNHVRFVLFWESYVKDPTSFMNELNAAANAADKWGIKVLYDNHQFHTSSWLNPQRGTGFPSFLFENNPAYPLGGGGGTQFPAAQSWWTDWWNRSIKDANGNDGWTLFADFLKKIVTTVDAYPSTIGYEIMSEPQVHNVDQWEKIGNFNTFITNELRTLTQKTIAYSMNIPIELDTPRGVNSENLAKMAPADKTNVVFKITVYGLPERDNYQEFKFDVLIKAAQIAGVPIYVGEWNNVKREKIFNSEGEEVWQINKGGSDITQDETNRIVQMFKEIPVFGWAYWNWNFKRHGASNFNLITLKNGNIQTTQYYELLKNAVSSNLTSSSSSTNNIEGGQGTVDEIDLKIISHQQGQQVPAGELTISGTSTDNPTTDCQVSVDVNDIKPLQNATATGPGGVNDYSTWQFTYTEDYQLIKEGVNELTSKLSCISDPTNVTKYYSVNVTGTSATQSPGTSIAPSILPTP